MASLSRDPPVGADPQRIGRPDRWRSTPYSTRERPANDPSGRLLRTEGERDAAPGARAKDDFLADLAHELLSPLQAMVGWLTVLREGPPDPEMQARALDVMERGLAAQADLVHELLDASRIATGKLTIVAQDVDFAAIVRNAIEDLRPAAEAKGVDLEGPEALEPLIVPGDAKRLAQVVTNLLTNAVKFTPEGGSVRVELSAGAEEVVLEVRDNGRGIAPELLPHVFDRLRQGEDMAGGSREGGLGLGLAIARHLVDRHGGSLAAESEGEGRGALFRVSLPRSAALR